MLTIKAGNYTLATYEYASNNGKLLKLTYGNGDYEEYVYDELERLVQTKLNGVTEYTVKYDNNGRLSSLTEDGATHIYEYDSLDRLIRAWQEDGNGNAVLAVENCYDDLGRAKGSTYVVGDRTMAYEINYEPNSNLVDYILMPVAEMQSSISYTYDAFERVTRKQNSFFSAINYYEEYGYYNYTDAEGAQHTTSLVSSLKLSGNTPNTPTAVYTYTYDNLGNITQIKKDGVQISSYSYDTLGQLTTEIDNANSRVYNYTYDKSGNITRKTVYNLSTAEVIDSIVYTYGNTSWGDLLTAYDGAAITYDAIGNPTKWRDISTMTWEGRELQSATVTAGPRVTYEYNSSGIRTKKTLGSAIEYKYTLDGTKILSETATQLLSGSSYTLYYLYDASGSVQGFIYNNQYYYFQKNLQGDVIRILNSNGAVVTEYTYDAWGNVLTTTGSLASTVGRYNPFRYRSYYYDAETGFYYLQSRYYDPTVGRFLNADHPELIGANGGIIGNNLFAYCNNNSITFADYSGCVRTYNVEETDDGDRLNMDEEAIAFFEAHREAILSAVMSNFPMQEIIMLDIYKGLTFEVRERTGFEKAVSAFYNIFGSAILELALGIPPITLEASSLLIEVLINGAKEVAVGMIVSHIEGNSRENLPYGTYTEIKVAIHTMGESYGNKVTKVTTLTYIYQHSEYTDGQYLFVSKEEYYGA